MLEADLFLTIPDDKSDQELAMVVALAQTRRLLSVTAIKAQVGCLLYMSLRLCCLFSH